MWDTVVISLLCIYWNSYKIGLVFSQANGALTDQIDRTQSVIFYLESVGADINSKDKYGLTPLHFAAMRGNDVAALDLLHCDNIRIEVGHL